jgi:hypothetical protein
VIDSRRAREIVSNALRPEGVQLVVLPSPGSALSKSTGHAVHKYRLVFFIIYILLH